MISDFNLDYNYENNMHNIYPVASADRSSK